MQPKLPKALTLAAAGTLLKFADNALDATTADTFLEPTAYELVENAPAGNAAAEAAAAPVTTSAGEAAAELVPCLPGPRIQNMFLSSRP